MKTSDRDERIELVERFFSGTGPSYDRIVQLFTLGIDRRWKRRILKKLEAPRAVLDLACGTGILTLQIARRFPRCRVVGVELREEYLAFARQKAKADQLRNVEWIRCRAEDLHLGETFDYITSSYLSKYADLERLIPPLVQMLSDGGTLLFHDFIYPPNPVLSFCWEGYFKLLQAFAGPVFPEWQNVFHGLPELMRRTTWLDDLQAALIQNGLKDIRREILTLQGSAIVTAVKSCPAPQS